MTCIDCGAASQPQTGGLCPTCLTDCVWIVRPAAHREMQRREFAAEAPILESLGYAVISSHPAGNDEWYCDRCNNPIGVAGDVHLIAALSSWAFCIPCASRLRPWPDAWATPRPCPCLACSPAAETMAASA